jgi:hypothetical protein
VSTFIQITILRDRASIVSSSRPIICLCVITAHCQLVQYLGKPIPGRSSTNPIKDHAKDLRTWTWSLEVPIHVARGSAVVSLHQAWVRHAIVGRSHSDAASGLLKKNRQDETVVDIGQVGDVLNGIQD